MHNEIFMVEIRPIKRQDLIDMYGHSFPMSVKGFAAVLNDRVIGVAGVAFSNPLACFSKINGEMKKYPRKVVEAVRLIRELLNSIDHPVYATPDEDEETAIIFLQHVGFQKTVNEGVYLWPQQYPS